MYVWGMTTELGTIVRARREALGLTTRQLGALAGISGAYVSQIENGKVDIPSPEVLGPLARALGVEEQELLRAVGYLRSPAEATGNPLLGAEMARRLGEPSVEAVIEEMERIASLGTFEEQVEALKRLSPRMLDAVRRLTVALVQHGLGSR